MSTGGGFIAGSIIGKLLLDKTGWNASIQAVEQDTKLLGDKVKQLGEKFTEAGQKMQSAGRGIALFGAALTGAVGVGVKAFADFDAAMTESMAIMGNVSGAMKTEMVNAARQIAEVTTFSATEAAKAYYFLASAGYDAAESVKVLPIAAKFAQAGMFNLEQATSLLADAQSALGMRIRGDAVANMQNMARVANVLAKANILCNASIEQLSESLTTRAGAALRMVGKSVEEGTAVLAAFAQQGVKGAEAGTRLDIVLRDLQTRAIQNKDVFEKYKVTVFDASGEMRNMADIIGDLEKALAGKSDEMKRSILMEMEFADRSVASILNLVGMSNEIRRYEAELRKAGGTTEEIANKQLNTLNSQLKLTRDAVTEMAASFGETLAPAVTSIVVKLREAAGAVAAFAREHPALTQAVTLSAGILGVFLGIVGGVIFALGSMAKSVGAIMTTFPGLVTWVARLAPWLTRISLVAGTAFAGWNLGRYIGEVTGLDAVYERVFDKVFRFVGIIKEQNAELGLGHASAYAIQIEAIGRATELSGGKVKNFIDAKQILEEQFRKTGTTGNQVLDDWLKKFPQVAKETKATTGTVGGLKGALDSLTEAQKKLAEEMGAVSRVDLEKKYRDMLAVLSAYKGKLTEPAEKELIEDLIALRSEIDGTKTHTVTLDDTLKAFDETLAKLFTEGEVADWGESWSAFTKQMQRDFETASEADVKAILNMAIPAELIWLKFKLLGDALGASARTAQLLLYEIMRIQLAAAGIHLPGLEMELAIGGGEGVVNKAKSLMQEVSTVVSDAMRNIARSIVDAFGITEALAYKPIPWEKTGVAAYFKKAYDAVQADYDNKLSAMRLFYDQASQAADRAFDATELKIKRREEDEDIRYERAYERDREAIEHSKMTEAQKEAALRKLELKYEDEKLARERKREDARLAREEAHQRKLAKIQLDAKAKELQMEKDLQLELDRIRKDEERAKDFQARQDEQRQQGLWASIKNIAATAIEQIAQIGLTKLVTGLFDKLIGKAKDLGKSIVDSVGGAASSAASGAGSMAGSFLSAASSIANIVTAVASVIDLFKKAPSGAGDGMGRVVERQDIQTSLLTRIFEDINGNLKPTLWDISTKAGTQISWLDKMNTWLSKIHTGISDLVDKIQPAASGWQGTVSHPTLFLAHPNEDVSITPPYIGGGVQMVPRGGQAGPTSVNLTFHVSALDGANVETVFRRKIVPAIQDYFDHDYFRLHPAAMRG